MSEQNQWADRIAAAAKALSYGKVEDFEADLMSRMGLNSTHGVTALDDEDVFKFGDFREAFKSMPVGVLRMAFKALKGGKKTEPGEPAGSTDPRINALRGLGLKVRLEDADTAILLPLYLPDKPTDPITVALKKRFGDKAVVAFRDDGAVAVRESLDYMADLEQNYPQREAITVDGKLTELWPIGSMPNRMVEEDPLFPGQPLRNGYSVVNNRNWTGVSHANRQLCRIIVERGDIDANNKDAVLRLLERARTEKGLQEAYEEADLEFRQKQKKDDLPKLKVELGSSSSKPNNPFGVKRSY